MLNCPTALDPGKARAPRKRCCQNGRREGRWRREGDALNGGAAEANAREADDLKEDEASLRIWRAPDAGGWARRSSSLILRGPGTATQRKNAHVLAFAAPAARSKRVASRRTGRGRDPRHHGGAQKFVEVRDSVSGRATQRSLRSLRHGSGAAAGARERANLDVRRIHCRRSRRASHSSARPGACFVLFRAGLHSR